MGGSVFIPQSSRKSQSEILLKVSRCFFNCTYGHSSGTDLLSSQNTTVNSTFGSGSSLIKWFYIAEIIMGLFIYIKARSPLVFVGIVMAIIFTRVAFGIAS